MKNNSSTHNLVEPLVSGLHVAKSDNLEIPFAEYTAEHCLLHCKIFTKFIVYEGDLQAKLVNYVLS